MWLYTDFSAAGVLWPGTGVAFEKYWASCTFAGLMLLGGVCWGVRDCCPCLCSGVAVSFGTGAAVVCCTGTKSSIICSSCMYPACTFIVPVFSSACLGLLTAWFAGGAPPVDIDLMCGMGLRLVCVLVWGWDTPSSQWNRMVGFSLVSFTFRAYIDIPRIHSGHLRRASGPCMDFFVSLW